MSYDIFSSLDLFELEKTPILCRNFAYGFIIFETDSWGFFIFPISYVQNFTVKCLDERIHSKWRLNDSVFAYSQGARYPPVAPAGSPWDPLACAFVHCLMRLLLGQVLLSESSGRCCTGKPCVGD